MHGPHYEALPPDSSVDNTNQVIKVGNGEVAYFHIVNEGTVDAFFHIYDAVTANVTVGTTVPKWTFLVPAGVGATQVGAYEYTGPPLHFDRGAVYACTVEALGAGTNPTTKPKLLTLNYR